ncbi:MAG: hypothetical protein WAP34_08155, partial [Desulfomonilia bacterium]
GKEKGPVMLLSGKTDFPETLGKLTEGFTAGYCGNFVFQLNLIYKEKIFGCQEKEMKSMRKLIVLHAE